MSTRENALIVFARAPRPGQVKTRLTPPFTPEEACEIHMALLGDVLERAARTASGASITLAWSGPDAHPASVAEIPAGVVTTIQSGGDLGERMGSAIQSALRAGHRRVVILGSDAPTLPGDHLTAAFDALSRAEVVLGPSSDGGYYLIGMTRLHLELFRGVQWGTKDVLSVTRQRLRKAGVPFVELGTWHDVDTPGDVALLWKEMVRIRERHPDDLPRRTWKVLARLAPGGMRE